MSVHQQAITISNPSNGSSLPHPTEFGNIEDYLNWGVPLYEASVTGDWETAELIFDKRPDMVRFGITKNLDTALHVAAAAKWTQETIKFAENLVHRMTSEELELKNNDSNTAFWLACAFEKTPIVIIMVTKNRSLLDIRGKDEYFPLSIAAKNGAHRVVQPLYMNFQKMRGNHWTDNDRISTLLHCLETDIYDTALQIIEDHPGLAGNVSLLEVLAPKYYAFNRYKKERLVVRIIEAISACRFFGMKVQPVADEERGALKLLKVIWGAAVRTMNIDEIDDMLTRTGILFVAAESGNTRFIVELLRTYPHLMFATNEDGHTIFHIAVMHRHCILYNLLYEITNRYDILKLNDKSGNNLLHLLGKTTKEMAPKAHGASLLMQRELLWLKEIQRIMPPYSWNAKNKYGQTPFELFSKENEDQISKGLKWMKDCMVVATLIVTVAFAVAFTVPGGYDQDHGPPLFIHKRTFLVFVIADAISLFSASTSLLVFLSVLTSRHDYHDFLSSLPTKLMVGLLSLVISVVAMMVTFSASFFVLYHKGLKWVPYLIAALATVPVFVFAVLELPLIMDMFRSTYKSRYLFDPHKRVLYPTKPRLHSNN